MNIEIATFGRADFCRSVKELNPCDELFISLSWFWFFLVILSCSLTVPPLTNVFCFWLPGSNAINQPTASIVTVPKHVVVNNYAANSFPTVLLDNPMRSNKGINTDTGRVCVYSFISFIHCYWQHKRQSTMKGCYPCPCLMAITH